MIPVFSGGEAELVSTTSALIWPCFQTTGQRTFRSLHLKTVHAKSPYPASSQNPPSINLFFPFCVPSFQFSNAAAAFDGDSRVREKLTRLVYRGLKQFQVVDQQ